jgi:Ca2+-dependent lipid-binding protein
MSFVGSNPCYIVIDLYCAEGLLAGDDDGSTDPYFVFTFQNKTVKSLEKKSTLNPIYLQRIRLDGVIGENNQILPMFVTAFNKNPIKDQTIGICYIDLQRGLREGWVGKNQHRN